MVRVATGLFGALISVAGQPSEVLELEFIAASERGEAAAAEYRQIWCEDGARIVEALSEATGVTLGEKRIRVVVREAVSRSGVSGQPMVLRSSYPESTKRATLVHELAHRFLSQLDSDTKYTDVHFPLSLLLYEVWSELWGEDFARAQAEVESRRSQRYRLAWDWILSMSGHDRAQKWEDYVSGLPVHPVSENPTP